MGGAERAVNDPEYWVTWLWKEFHCIYITTRYFQYWTSAMDSDDGDPDREGEGE